MQYPRIIVDLNKMTENVALVTSTCAQFGVEIIGVTKGFCAHPLVAEAYVAGGVRGLADSRLKNLEKLSHIEITRYLLRIPMLSEVKRVIEVADVSFNSELETIRALGKAAADRGRVHNVLLMVELGDIREGVLQADVPGYVREILKIEGVRLKGLGANLSCFGGVIPDELNMGRLASMARDIEREFNLKLELVSGGSTSSFPLLHAGKMPGEVNQLRFGEIFIQGTELLAGSHHDIFKLQAEIIEVKVKPSVPTGKIGVDAFQRIPVFEDRGIRKRALLAVGRQDVDPDHIKPCDREIEVIGASSDHLIIDITGCSNDYSLGDIVDFNLNYVSILRLMTSEYVYKSVVKGEG